MVKHLGLVIYVTVGAEDERRLIIEQYSIPKEHIIHSRDASFVKDISRITGGRGVDCVLDSLSGELLRASWGCLATLGSFVEISLRDITNKNASICGPSANLLLRSSTVIRFTKTTPQLLTRRLTRLSSSSTRVSLVLRALWLRIQSVRLGRRSEPCNRVNIVVSWYSCSQAMPKLMS